MTRLTSVEIEGLAARSDAVSLTFGRGVNILFGVNGSGKTSLLRLVYSALSDDITLIRRVPFVSAIVVFESDTGELITREITARHVAETLPPLPQTFYTSTGPMTIPAVGPQNGWHSSASPGINFLPTYLTIYRLFGDPILQFWGGGVESPYSEARLDHQFLQLVTSRWATYANQLLARIRTIQDEGITAVLESLFSTERRHRGQGADADDAYGQVRNFFDRRNITLGFSREIFVERYQQDTNLRGAVQNIQTTEIGIAKAEERRDELERLVSRFIRTNKKVEFSDAGIQVVTEHGGIGIDLLSSGEKHLLRLFVECLSAQSSCMIIDEPELSLHIDWQRELPRALETINPEAQIVMATHSPDIMADVPDCCIMEL